jgi:S-adenosylmethionine-dependent methyltransferase
MTSTKDLKRFYDNLIKEHGAIRRSISTPMWSFLDALKWNWIKKYVPAPRATILDAGGGEGEWSLKLAKEGYRVYLADISKKSLEAASKRASEMGLLDRIRVVEADIKDLSFPDNFFDYALCEGDVLSLVPFPSKALKEIGHTLKCEDIISANLTGYYKLLLFSLKQGIESYREFLKKPVAFSPKGSKPMIEFKAYTPEKAKKMFGRAGFRILKIAGEVIFTDLLFAPKFEELKDKESFKEMVKLELKLMEEESLTPYGGHLQIVAKKRL